MWRPFDLDLTQLQTADSRPAFKERRQRDVASVRLAGVAAAVDGARQRAGLVVVRRFADVQSATALQHSPQHVRPQR